MSYWDLRMHIEQSIPWWLPFGWGAIVIMFYLFYTNWRFK